MNQVIAGVVTFNPDIALLDTNLKAIAQQVDRVVVFDNGSDNADEVARLVEPMPNAEVCRSPINRGIAHALNRIGERALDLGALWLVTLDQDSVAASDMVAHLLDVADEITPIVTPYIVDRNKMTVAQYRAQNLPAVQYYWHAARRGAITSGSLVNLGVLFKVGAFDERLFIDYVDYDLNQRVMLAGLQIARANSTYLLHEVGKAEPTWLRVPRKSLDGVWGLERFYSFGHNPTRCYYKARNRVLFTRKYGRLIGLTHQGVWQLPAQLALTLLFEREKIAKLKAFALGVRDGFRMPLAEQGATDGAPVSH